MSDKPGKTTIQLMIFESALERLLKGEGQRVPAGIKLSVAQLAKESGIGSGTLYYPPYAEFRIRAARRMAQFNAGSSEKGSTINASSEGMLQALRQDRDNEKRLKERYREARDELAGQVKRLCANLGIAEHALYQATLRIAELEHKFETVTGTAPDSYISEGNNSIALLPRNLQRVK
ncbi:hypothetical protein [Enterobacter mori]|uniref:hypothetical protein n=1 Tax=Enterobacter mori TaxID=539813 RepID=UPI003B8400BD